MNPIDYKNRLIIAQNQSNPAVELTRLYFRGRIATRKEIMQIYIKNHDDLMKNMQDNYISTKEVKQDE